MKRGCSDLERKITTQFYTVYSIKDLQCTIGKESQLQSTSAALTLDDYGASHSSVIQLFNMLYDDVWELERSFSSKNDPIHAFIFTTIVE